MKRTLQFIFLFCIGILLFTAFQVKLHQADPVYKTGDIIFQNSHSSQSEAIKLATHSKFSHVGVIVIKNKQAFVLEAVEPVSLTPLKKWIARGDQSYFEIKRPKQNLPSTPAVQKKLDSLQNFYLSKHYDIPFQWTDDKLYCSELVWKLYQKVYGIELCATRQLKEFDLSSSLVKMALQQRYGTAIPMNEQVVSPEDLYQSSLLQSIK
ncbi:MAG: YiiX family permuted papain-like enzyme [Cytophagaceae bacterium]|nr:YiiX family permuted papain-like enzyme [Cytophagaceae bacterium]